MDRFVRFVSVWPESIENERTEAWLITAGLFPRADQPRDRLPVHSSDSSTMAARKGKTKTLTKIDPDTLKIKAYSFSQHATATGHRPTRATTSINPTVRNAAPLREPVVFNPDPSNFVGDSSGDEDGSEGVSRDYYIARVCPFYPLSASTLSPERVDSHQR